MRAAVRAPQFIPFEIVIAVDTCDDLIALSEGVQVLGRHKEALQVIRDVIDAKLEEYAKS